MAIPKEVVAIKLAAPEIYKVLVLCMQHVSFETSKWLQRQVETSHPVIVVDSRAFGFLISVGDKQIMAEQREETIPEDVWACMCAAHTQDCAYLIFDTDAAPVNELSLFDW